MVTVRKNNHSHTCSNTLYIFLYILKLFYLPASTKTCTFQVFYLVVHLIFCTSLVMILLQSELNLWCLRFNMEALKVTAQSWPQKRTAIIAIQYFDWNIVLRIVCWEYAVAKLLKILTMKCCHFIKKCAIGTNRQYSHNFLLFRNNNNRKAVLKCMCVCDVWNYLTTTCLKTKINTLEKQLSVYTAWLQLLYKCWYVHYINDIYLLFEINNWVITYEYVIRLRVYCILSIVHVSLQSKQDSVWPQCLIICSSHF